MQHSCSRGENVARFSTRKSDTLGLISSPTERIRHKHQPLTDHNRFAVRYGYLRYPPEVEL